MKVWHRTGSKGAQVPSGFDLVIPRGDPDFAAVFQAHLGRTEDMAGGVKTQGDAVMLQGLAVGQGLQVDVWPSRARRMPSPAAAAR